MRREPELARRFFDRFEPVHAVTYFAPEARAALDGLGYRGFWMGYFAARSAPLGMVPAEVVTAIFYNFAPERVAKALPAAWQIAGPDAALRARQDSAVAALRRYGVDADENVTVAAELAGKAARLAPVDGRPLFAANLALPWTEDPLAALWHAATLLREQRGDAHVAVLAAAGISGRESNVLHAAASGIPRDYLARSRDYDEDSWRHHEQQLGARGLFDDDGSLTTAGRALKKRIEATTDELALSALDALADDEVEALFGALTPITRAVIAGGDLPAVTPMKLRRDELQDDSAHLVSS
ncbi:MAG: SCO6745 family protein [Mycobacterium sp.]